MTKNLPNNCPTTKFPTLYLKKLRRKIKLCCFNHHFFFCSFIILCCFSRKKANVKLNFRVQYRIIPLFTLTFFSLCVFSSSVFVWHGNFNKIYKKNLNTQSFFYIFQVNFIFQWLFWVFSWKNIVYAVIMLYFWSNFSWKGM